MITSDLQFEMTKNHHRGLELRKLLTSLQLTNVEPSTATSNLQSTAKLVTVKFSI